MSKRTRYFVTTAAAILGVGLTTGLVASYMGVSALSRAAAPDELQYVPADAAVVAFADVRQIMDSEFRERFRQFEPDTSERDEFESKTGVNIESDIHSVVATVFTDGQNQITPNGGMLLLARGRFEQSRIEALALEHGGQTEDYRGVRLLIHQDKGDDDIMAIGFLQADLVALGGANAVKKAIDASGGRNLVSTNADLMRQIAELDGSNAWAVGRFDAIAGSANVPSAIQGHLSAIQRFSAATHINGGVNGIFKAEARDEQSAQQMREVVQGFLAFAKLQSGSAPQLKPLIDSLQLSGEGNNVVLSFNLPSELFDALRAMKELDDRK